MEESSSWLLTRAVTRLLAYRAASVVFIVERIRYACIGTAVIWNGLDTGKDRNTAEDDEFRLDVHLVRECFSHPIESDSGHVAEHLELESAYIVAILFGD